MTPTQYNKPLRREQPRKMYFQLSKEHKEVISLLAELYIQRAEANGRQIGPHQRFDLYNNFANLYTEDTLDKKYKELYKNRSRFTEQQRNAVNANRYYDPFARNKILKPSAKRALFFLSFVNQRNFYLLLIIGTKPEKLIKVSAAASFHSVNQTLRKIGTLRGFYQFLPPAATFQPKRKTKIFVKLVSDLSFRNFSVHFQLLHVLLKTKPLSK